jgi:Tol biopolymer transport system component
LLFRGLYLQAEPAPITTDRWLLWTTRANHPLPQFGRRPVWQPDGRAILFVRDEQHSGENSAWLYLVTSGELIPLPTLPGRLRAFDAWNADGRVIYEAQDGTWLARLQSTGAGGREWAGLKHLETFDPGGNHWTAVAPAGDSLVAYDGSDLSSASLWIVRPERERVLFDRRRPISIGNCCAWAQDGSYFAYFAPDPRYDSQELTVVNANGQGRRVVLASRELGQGELMSLSSSPDGQVIALGWSPAGDGFPSENNEIHTINLDGTGLRQLTSKGAGGYDAIQWSPNGRYLGFQRKGQVWVAEVGGLK